MLKRQNVYLVHLNSFEVLLCVFILFKIVFSNKQFRIAAFPQLRVQPPAGTAGGARPVQAAFHRRRAAVGMQVSAPSPPGRRLQTARSVPSCT